MTDSQTQRRLPWAALALSLAAMGVGHLYSGRVAKGMVIYLIWFVVLLLCVAAAVLPASALLLAACILGPALAIVATYIYAALDAYVAAKRSDPCYQLQDYNRAGLYALLIVVQLACAVALTAGLREFVFEGFYVPTRSMVPSVLQGDRILANKLMARQRFPERGDLIVFRNPQPQDGRLFVKRVVALAGDEVVIDDEGVMINGKRLPRDRIPQEALRSIRGQVAGDAYFESNAGRRYRVAYNATGGNPEPASRIELTVPQRSVYVLGDNRDRSRDSRHFGAIHVSDVVGYVQYIYLPAATWSRFGVAQS